MRAPGQSERDSATPDGLRRRGAGGAPWLAGATEQVLRALLTDPPAAPLRTLPGRTSFVWSGPEGARYVVKRLWARARRLPGPFGRVVVCQVQREHAALAALTALGAPVPRPVGWVAAELGRGLVAAVVMELVPHAESLRQRLARVPADGVALAPELAALVARLHGAGWYHQDLYLEHVVIERGSGRLVLLDLARARRQGWPVRHRWFQKDLGALASTAGVDEAARCLFFERYAAALGLSPRQRALWARAALARAARIQRHVPRFRDPSTREGDVY